MSEISPPGLYDALAVALSWIDGQEDYTVRAIALRTVSKALKAWESEVAVKRYEVALALAESGWTMQDIGNLLGVSRQRAQQLVDGK